MSNPQTTDPIISDEEVERVHANASFGPTMSKRRVVNDGVLKTAMGYSMGHTQLCILMEHGLVKTPKPGRCETALTKKGVRYLQSVFRYADIEKLGETS